MNLNQLTRQQLEQHVTILGWLYIVSHAIFILIGGFVFVLLVSIGAISGDMEATTILGIVGVLIGLFLAALGLPGLVVGADLLQRKAWGRTLALVLGILNLVGVPIGTLIGLYTLWVLLQDTAPEYFATTNTTP